MLLVDHLLFAVIAFVHPIVGYISWQRLMRRIAAGETVNRPQLYSMTMAGHWTLFAVTLVLWVGAGRGWIALALVVFVQWSPTRAIAGAALFGGAQALIPRLQALGLEVPIYLLSMFPYVLTIAVLIFASRRAQTRQQEPRGLGQVFIRQDR